jgi:hypothetical protein
MPEMTPLASIQRKQTAGSTSPDSIEAQLNHFQSLIASQREQLP